jgi:hypothetical protein
MPNYFKTDGLRETAITDSLGQDTLSTQNAPQRWVHAHHLKTLDFFAKLAALVPKNESEPDLVPHTLSRSTSTKLISVTRILS